MRLENCGFFAGRQYILKKPDLYKKNKIHANTNFVLVYTFLSMYVYFVRTSSTSLPFVFFFI